jgi:hypothetical protein
VCGSGPHLVDILAGQHTEGALMHVHDGGVGAPPCLNILVSVQANQQEVTRLLG